MGNVIRLATIGYYGKETSIMPPCPICSKGLSRIRRRAIDRLQSLVIPVLRYRCANAACSWEGNLPGGKKIPVVFWLLLALCVIVIGTVIVR